MPLQTPCCSHCSVTIPTEKRKTLNLTPLAIITAFGTIIIAVVAFRQYRIYKARQQQRSVHCTCCCEVFVLWLGSFCAVCASLGNGKALREMPVISRQIGLCHDQRIIDKNQRHKIMVHANTAFFTWSSTWCWRASLAKWTNDHASYDLFCSGFCSLTHSDSQLQVWSAWKIMKNRVGSTWFEIQAKSSLLGAKKLQGEHECSFRISRRRFPRTENDNESSIAAYKLQLTPPAGFSSKLFNQASSSLVGFRRMTLRWKAWDPSKATAPFLFPGRQGNER